MCRCCSRSPASATAGRRGAAAGEPRPYIYALSLAIYCTSWTFFGSVGLASERGLGIPGDLYRPGAGLHVRLAAAPAASSGWPRPRRSPRSPTSSAPATARALHVALIATLIALIGAIPYIALQLKAISGSVSLMVEHYTGSPLTFDPFVSDISLIVAMLLAVFAVAVRHAPRRRHRAPGRAGAGGRGGIGGQARRLPGGRPRWSPSSCSTARATSSTRSPPNPQVRAGARLPDVARHLARADRALSGFAIIMLPRQFHVTDRREPQRKRAAGPRPGSSRSISSPINLFVLPIAFAGAGAGRRAHQRRPLRAVAAAAQRP